MVVYKIGKSNRVMLQKKVWRYQMDNQKS